MAEPGRNVQADFLEAVKGKSLDVAVDILKSVHDAKGALRRAGRAADSAGAATGLPRIGAVLPKLDDFRRVGDLLFDVARLQIKTVETLFGIRSRHTAKLEERVGDILGFPVRGNQSEVLELTIPVGAVEGDRRERPTDGDATASCEIHRQFRVKNSTGRAWPAVAAAVKPVDISWNDQANVTSPGVSDGRKVARDAFRVDVLRDCGEVAPGSVLPLRLRVRWTPGALTNLSSLAEATGQFVLEGAGGEVVKVIDVLLRFNDLGG